MKLLVSTLAVSLLVASAGVERSIAAALKAPTVGCANPADATKLAALQGRKAAQDAAAQPLEASRACMSFAKGIALDVDETKPPLTCVRLTGDLSCYWIASALIDEHPGEKGGGAKRGGGGGHRH